MIFSRSGRGRSKPTGADTDAGADTAGTGGADGAPADPSPVDAHGPYDVADAPAGVRRLDLGSLRIPSVTGVEVRVQANPDGQVQRVALVHGDSALQLAAFAAPRSEKIWPEVRPEIETALAADGAIVRHHEGPFGTELVAELTTGDGRRQMRIVGVDGPRWMLRADFHGPAAADPSVGGALLACLRGLVVDRGQEARPVREPLPLRLTPEMAAQLQQQAQAQSAGQAQGQSPGRGEGGGQGQSPGQARTRTQPKRSSQTPRTRRT